MAATSHSGMHSHVRNIRPPMPVSVWSMLSSSESFWLSARIVRRISRLRSETGRSADSSCRLILLQALNVIERGLLRFVQIFEDRSGGRDEVLIAVADAESLQRGDAEMLESRFFA